MSKIQLTGTKSFVIDVGDGNEAIFFSHGLLFSHRMFEKQIDHFSSDFRCVASDHRGQGQSEVTDGGYDMDSLTNDIIELIENSKMAPCHFVGLSMGGFVGMRIAARRPDLLKSLILLGTSAEAEPKENLPKYRLLNFIARWIGVGLVVNQVTPLLFGKTMLNDVSRKDEMDRWKKELVSNHKIGVTRAVKGVITRKGVEDEIVKIKTPTLILVGEEDVSYTAAKI